MYDSVALDHLVKKYTFPDDHPNSDYFGLLRELIDWRNSCVEDESHQFLQQRIDAVYELVLDEIISNDGPPVQPVKFGTSGWRGILGKDFFCRSVSQVTEAVVAVYRSAAANNELRTALGVDDIDEARKRGCVVGYDNRFGAEILAAKVVDVLTGNGFKVFWAGETTTGVLSAAVLEKAAAFSINLTPSHNPLEYSGYKFNGADAGPAAAVVTSLITEKAREIVEVGDLFQAEPDSTLVEDIDSLGLWISHVRKNKDQHGLDYDRIIADFETFDDLIVAVDSVHGASRLHIRRLLGNGENSGLILERADRDHTFGGVAPEPSSANLKQVISLLRQRAETFKLGAIIDPDGDRIRFTDGEREIAMNQFGAMAYHFLHQVKGKKGMVAKTVATSNFANCMAESFGEEVFEPPVGFKEFKPVIGRALVFFEESDGISIRGHTPEKDAYIGLLLALDMIMTLKKNLGDYLAELEEKYGAFFPVVSGVTVSSQGADLREMLSGLERYKTGVEVVVGSEKKRIQKVIDIDGRKMIFEDGGWIMIRPSGTEPKVRFYVEARSETETSALLETAHGMLAEVGIISG